MPKGEGRPYNKDEKTIAKANKNLRNKSNNSTMNKMDGKASNAKVGHGGLFDTYANEAGVARRSYGKAYDESEAKEIRKNKKGDAKFFLK